MEIEEIVSAFVVSLARISGRLTTVPQQNIVQSAWLNILEQGKKKQLLRDIDLVSYRVIVIVADYLCSLNHRPTWAENWPKL